MVPLPRYRQLVLLPGYREPVPLPGYGELVPVVQVYLDHLAVDILQGHDAVRP